MFKTPLMHLSVSVKTAGLTLPKIKISSSEAHKLEI